MHVSPEMSKAQNLHHKSVSGAILTPDEEAQLMEWYAQMDAEEEAMFAKTRAPAEDLGRMKKKIDDMLEQIVATAQRIQSQERDNERLRSEIETLKRQLAQKTALLPT